MYTPNSSKFTEIFRIEMLCDTFVAQVRTAVRIKNIFEMTSAVNVRIL